VTMKRLELGIHSCRKLGHVAKEARRKELFERSARRLVKFIELNAPPAIIRGEVKLLMRCRPTD